MGAPPGRDPRCPRTSGSPGSGVGSALGSAAAGSRRSSGGVGGDTQGRGGHPGGAALPEDPRIPGIGCGIHSRIRCGRILTVQLGPQRRRGVTRAGGSTSPGLPDPGDPVWDPLAQDLTSPAGIPRETGEAPHRPKLPGIACGILRDPEQQESVGSPGIPGRDTGTVGAPQGGCGGDPSYPRDPLGSTPGSTPGRISLVQLASREGDTGGTRGEIPATPGTRDLLWDPL